METAHRRPTRSGRSASRSRRRGIAPEPGPRGPTRPAPAGRPSPDARRRRSRDSRSAGVALVDPAQRLGLRLALLRVVADAEAEPHAGRDPLRTVLALRDVEEDRASLVVAEEAEALLGEEAVDDADPALLAARVAGDLVQDGELGREGWVGRRRRLLPLTAGGERRAPGRERRVLRQE